MSPDARSATNSLDIIVSSGLVTEDELSRLLPISQASGQDLSKLLVSEGLLTPFQLQALSEGRGESLRAGNYDILDRLGAGGMGTVFKARHRRMKRVVALKVLAAHLSENPVFVKRFQREVETIAALGHPNIVMAYDADVAEIGDFLVMEFVNGMDLAAYVERVGPLSVEKAAKFILQTARGLVYAHSQGIIHRDIKPNNLLLDEYDNIKITDLGLARLNHGAGGPAAGFDVTMPGGAIGTVDYMPPEQAVDSTTINHRADIYSLGCTLHFLLTGKPPYSAATIVSLLLKHRDAEIPKLRAVRSDVPPQLENLFQRMLAKQPELRVQQMSEVVTELEAISGVLTPSFSAPVHASATVQLAPGWETSGEATFATSKLSEHPPTTNVEPKIITVLIVEPSRVQASIIRGYLSEQSISVAGTAKSGREAIDAVRKLKPRAVISAMYLPDMNGVELAQQIRSEHSVESPGFVLITSDADEESASLTKVNRVLILPKPFTATQMMEAMSLVAGASNSLPDAAVPAFDASGPKDRSKLRVLIVDDSTTARIHIRTVLEGFGFSQFLEVQDGAYAIAVAARENCDLIVTDYNMPLMDGRALVSYLRQNQSTAAIPIIMVTTETEPRLLDPVRKAGVAAILGKSFSAQEVGPIIDHLF